MSYLTSIGVMDRPVTNRERFYGGQSQGIVMVGQPIPSHTINGHLIGIPSGYGFVGQQQPQIILMNQQPYVSHHVIQPKVTQVTQATCKECMGTMILFVHENKWRCQNCSRVVSAHLI